MHVRQDLCCQSPYTAELGANFVVTGHLTGHACCEQVMKAGTSEAQRRRLGEGGLVVAVDARSQRLLRYEEKGTRGAAAMDAHCWGERDAVEARSGRLRALPWCSRSNWCLPLAPAHPQPSLSGMDFFQLLSCFL